MVTVAGAVPDPVGDVVDELGAEVLVLVSLGADGLGVVDAGGAVVVLGGLAGLRDAAENQPASAAWPGRTANPVTTAATQRRARRSRFTRTPVRR